jgi:serine/threonine protein kinase
MDLQGSGNYVFAEITARFLYFEHVCDRCLDKYISDESSGLEWNMGYEIVKGICGGLSYVHGECHIGHPDLKPENILMDATMVPKIADFGSSRIFSDKQPRIITQNCLWIRGYMPPEYISIGADIFSLGVVTTKTQSRIFGGNQSRIITKKLDTCHRNTYPSGRTYSVWVL